MKFDLTKYPVSDDGEQLKDEKDKLSNYRDMFMKALAADLDGNGEQVKGEEKYKRYDMYTRFRKSISTIELTAEEVVYLSKVILVFPVTVAGQGRDFLAKPEAEGA